MSKELVFKVVLQADTKDYVSNVKQSDDVTKAIVKSIKEEADKLREASKKAGKEVGKIVPDDLKEKADDAKSAVTGVTKAADELEKESGEASVSVDKLGDKLEETSNDASIASKNIAEVVPESTTKMASALTQNLSNATAAIKGAGINAGETAKNFTEFGRVSEKALGVLKSDLDQAKLKLQSLAATNATPQDIARAQAEVDKLEKEVNQAEQAFNQFSQASNQANQELKETELLSGKVSGELAGLKTGFYAVTGALAALGIGVTAQELARTADEWSNLNARVEIAIGTHGDAKLAMEDVVEVARITNSNLTATADLYARLTKIGQEMNIPQEQVLLLTKTINQAIRVSGGSAASAEAAITQLQQALASGVLRGDEFNSMMEQSPRLMQALADGIGVTTGELRKMSGEGKLTTEVVTNAILSQSETIQKEFSQFPLTIGASLENLKTSWTVFVGELDQTHGISTKVAESLKWVADNLDTIFNTLKLSAQAFIAYKALNIAAVFLDKAAGVRAASVAITQETASVVANTQAQLANATATRAASTAKAGLATASASSSKAVAASTASTSSSLGVLIGRLGALGIAITALGLLVPTVITPIGESIGEGLAKSVEKAKMAWHNLNAAADEDKRYMTAIEQLEFQLQNEAIAAKVSAEMKKEIAAAAEKGAAKTYDLSTASQELVTKFNQLVKDGKTASEALKEVGESMKFDSLTSINDAISALNMLERTGKITGQELRAELKAALVNEDFVVFQTNAQAAFAGTAQEANKMAQVTQVAMELALERTGLSTEQLKGQFTKTFQSASNDIQMIINHLDEYKAQGIDTGLALTASLNKAIDTAQSRQELDYAKAKLIELGDQGKITGEQVVYGLNLIEQKAGSLPKVLDPVLASFSALGIKTQDELNAIADLSQKNFEVVRKSGLATAESIKKAYSTMLNDAIATGDKARVSLMQAQAASLGLSAEIDTTGKASVKAMDELTESVERVGRTARGSAADGFRELGRVAREEARTSAQEWEDAMAKVDAQRKAQSASNSRGLSELQGGIDQMAEDYYNRLVAAGMDKSRARDMADKARYSLAVETTTALKGGTTQNLNTTKQQMEKTLDYWENKNSRSGASFSTGGNAPNMQVPNIQAPIIEYPKIRDLQNDAPTKNVRFEFVSGGKRFEMQGSQEDGDTMESILREFEMLKKAM
ncbi:tape measure protein [Acinetobacter haemolyticus]|uniref:tape measure protein n=1 Tax=Acinetobacter haemolyticus TaxID=29430 RepID=UPI0009D6B871|nr:tape measure protein [Acinetobacter haemolyticus]